jgi:hypothetical protein
MAAATATAAIVLALNLLLVLQIAGIPCRSRIVLTGSPRFTRFYLVSLAAERCPSLTFPGMR